MNLERLEQLARKGELDAAREIPSCVEFAYKDRHHDLAKVVTVCRVFFSLTRLPPVTDVELELRENLVWLNENNHDREREIAVWTGRLARALPNPQPVGPERCKEYPACGGISRDGWDSCISCSWLYRERPNVPLEIHALPIYIKAIQVVFEGMWWNFWKARAPFIVDYSEEIPNSTYIEDAGTWLRGNTVWVNKNGELWCEDFCPRLPNIRDRDLRIWDTTLK